MNWLRKVFLSIVGDDIQAKEAYEGWLEFIYKTRFDDCVIDPPNLDRAYPNDG